jgi:hypothetical protein
MNTCTYASAECLEACLFTAGRAEYLPSIIEARVAKTVFLHENRALFLESVQADLRSLRNYCIKHSTRKTPMTPATRPNGTTDMAWLGMWIADNNPDIQVYDYTKLPKAWLRVRSNYHLTFSYSGHNLSDAIACLAHGVNVAVVFDTRKGRKLPESWNGYTVIDGDMHDLRFLDPKGVVVGLRAKGKARKVDSAFVVKTNGTAPIGQKPAFVTFAA